MSVEITFYTLAYILLLLLTKMLLLLHTHVCNNTILFGVKYKNSRVNWLSTIVIITFQRYITTTIRDTVNVQLQLLIACYSQLTIIDESSARGYVYTSRFISKKRGKLIDHVLHAYIWVPQAVQIAAVRKQ